MYVQWNVNLHCIFMQWCIYYITIWLVEVIIASWDWISIMMMRKWLIRIYTWYPWRDSFSAEKVTIILSRWCWSFLEKWFLLKLHLLLFGDCLCWYSNTHQEGNSCFQYHSSLNEPCSWIVLLWREISELVNVCMYVCVLIVLWA